jgi:hypothetical protein
MERIAEHMWLFIVLAWFGLLIDFLIGRAGRDRVKEFVRQWWERFDHIHWHNFGREEGLFAGQLIEKWFGRRIWSWRRIVSPFSERIGSYPSDSIKISNDPRM